MAKNKNLEIEMVGYYPPDHEESRIGAYTIRHSVTDKQYHGSTCDIQRRRIEHLTDLRTGTHRNPGLQELAVQDPKFELDFTSTGNIKHAKKIEQEKIDATPNDLLLNVSLNTENHMQGMWQNPEMRERFRQARIGNTHGAGYRMTEEQRVSHAERLRGNKNALGHRHSDETRAQISASHLGQKKTEEAVAKSAEGRTKRRVVVDGVTYQNATVAAAVVGMSRDGVIKRCRSENFPNYVEISK